MTLVIMFLMLSVMTLLILEGKVRERQRFSVMEYEKLMYRFYQNYLVGESLDAQMIDEVPGFGLYNFYGDPLYRYGKAVHHVENEYILPFFNKEEKTIIVVRDLLNPFMPVSSSKERALFTGIYSKAYQDALNESDETKRTMIRYVYMVVRDEYVYRLLFLFRSLQIIFTLINTLIVVLIGRLYLRNMKYRKLIEEQERLVLLGVASRTLTHEIKNPLSSIRLQSSIIQRTGCEQHHKELRVINEEVERLSQLSERVGDFLRHPEGNPEVVDMSDLTVTYVDRFSGRIPILNRKDCPFLPIKIDPDRYRSILDNLINNALESESPEKDITISLAKHNHEALLTLSDKGKGISQEHMEKMFNPYFTTKSRGSGVGLSIVQSFVKAVDGQVNIQSQPGEGTQVSIRFPLHREEQ